MFCAWFFAVDLHEIQGVVHFMPNTLGIGHYWDRVILNNPVIQHQWKVAHTEVKMTIKNMLVFKELIVKTEHRSLYWTGWITSGNQSSWQVRFVLNIILVYAFSSIHVQG